MMIIGDSTKKKNITEEEVLKALNRYPDFVGARELARKMRAYKNWNTVEMHLCHLAEKRKAIKTNGWSFKGLK